MWQKLRDNVGVAVATAVVLGALTLFWNWASEGGLVRVLGGVTVEDISAVEQRMEEANTRALAASASLPRGAVVAFDRDDLDADRCPDGWTPFKPARARTIVGAGDPSAAPGKFGFDEFGQALPEYVRGQHGGEVEHTLTVKELPKHTHPLLKVGGIGGTHGAAAAANDQSTLESTMEAGGGQPHNNIPPFIALYFCKKD